MIFTLNSILGGLLSITSFSSSSEVCLLLLEDIPLPPHFAHYCLFLDRGQLVVFTDVGEVSYTGDAT